MSPQGLRNVCETVIEAGMYEVALELPKGHKHIKGWPRGEMMCVNSRGLQVRRFPAHRILRWLDANSL
jgi:hypothetical protein